MTEVKFENSISRATAIANPRQIERTIRGCKYSMDIIYNLKEEDEALEDMKMFAEGFKLLEFDYLGGHGSRGYGKVKFNNLSAECVIGNVSEDLLCEINDALKG